MQDSNTNIDLELTDIHPDHLASAVAQWLTMVLALVLALFYHGRWQFVGAVSVVFIGAWWQYVLLIQRTAVCVVIDFLTSEEGEE